VSWNLFSPRLLFTLLFDDIPSVDSPQNKVSTVKTSGSRGVYNKFLAHFLY
jgi:hypothetical protein